jgi:hypothetical protein
MTNYPYILSRNSLSTNPLRPVLSACMCSGLDQWMWCPNGTL